jgi:hypothetical protein
MTLLTTLPWNPIPLLDDEIIIPFMHHWKEEGKRKFRDGKKQQ